MRTYWSAHRLAARGHEVHVVTNAKEARLPFRMHMRAEDWKRCEAVYDAGSITVHWTDSTDRPESYLPMASPFVSQLATIAARVHSDRPFDVIFSHYMEPYGVAGHLAAQMTGVPHVARMAGSDAGRLWHHPDFEALYDHVLRSAEIIVAVGAVAERAIRRGVAPERIAVGGGFPVPEDLFTPDGPVLNLRGLRTEVREDPVFRDQLWGEFEGAWPYFGIYGKLGEHKGSFALLAAMQRLKQAGLNVGLVALAHHEPPLEQHFRARAQQLGLADRILQIPFLPHWRVPEFLRGCTAVCCLEQDFPIGFHAPIIPREVLLCGVCLVGSTELIRKLPSHERLPDGYGCVAIEDVNDVATLSQRLAAIVENPGSATLVGARGCVFARELQRDALFPPTLERVLEAAATKEPVPPAIRWFPDELVEDAANTRFPLTRLAAAAVAETAGSPVPPESSIDLPLARKVLAAIEQAIVDGRTSLRSLPPAVRIEIAIAAAESEVNEAVPAKGSDPLFRLRMHRWAMEEHNLIQLLPIRDPQLRIVEFDFEVSSYLGARTAAGFPPVPTPRPSYIVAFGRSEKGRRGPLLVDSLTARILQLSDGTRTALEIARELDHGADMSAVAENLKWIESLFVSGLIGLRARGVDHPNRPVQSEVHAVALGNRGALDSAEKYA